MSLSVISMLFIVATAIMAASTRCGGIDVMCAMIQCPGGFPPDG